MTKNSIKKSPDGVVIELEQDFVMDKEVYFPADGEPKMVKSGFSFKQAVEGIAFALLYQKMPHLATPFKASTVRFIEGRFYIEFLTNLPGTSPEDVAFEKAFPTPEGPASTERETV